VTSGIVLQRRIAGEVRLGRSWYEVAARFAKGGLRIAAVRRGFAVPAIEELLAPCDGEWAAGEKAR
jgi:hypothetical protein